MSINAPLPRYDPPMPPSDPRREVQDDGGTPGGRARHAVTIDGREPGIRGWFRALTPAQILAIGALAAISPFLMIPIGLFILFVLYQFTE